MIYAIDYADPSDFKNSNKYIFLNYNDYQLTNTYIKTIIKNKDKTDIIIYNQPDSIKKLKELNIDIIHINHIEDIKKDVH